MDADCTRSPDYLSALGEIDRATADLLICYLRNFRERAIKPGETTIAPEHYIVLSIAADAMTHAVRDTYLQNYAPLITREFSKILLVNVKSRSELESAFMHVVLVVAHSKEKKPASLRNVCGPPVRRKKPQSVPERRIIFP